MIKPYLRSRLKVALVTFRYDNLSVVLPHVADQRVPPDGDVVAEVALVRGDLRNK